MLDTLRQNSRSIFIYLIFGILIAVFIISFGPQAGQSAGCAPSTTYVAKVGDVEISDASFRFAVNALDVGASGARARAMRVREQIMDGLIERELLAQAAAERGFTISDEEVEERIAKGEMYLLGNRWPGQLIYFKDGVFDYDLLERYVRSRSLPSVAAFVNEQRREMLAQKMRELLAMSARVSQEEILERYRQEHTVAKIEYVKFEPRRIARTLDLSPTEIDQYAAAHEAELKKKYELDASLYKGRGKEVRLREIFVESERLKAGEKPPEEVTAKGAMPDPARAEAEAAWNRIKAGKDFAQVAREVSDDRSSARGGDLGWRPVQSLGLPADVAKAVESLGEGQMTNVIPGPTGYYIVRVEGRREGDLAFEQVKRDLAEEALREEKARQAARAAAEEALAKAKAGTPLDQQFEKEEEVTAPAGPLEIMGPDGKPMEVELPPRPQPSAPASSTSEPAKPTPEPAKPAPEPAKPTPEPAKPAPVPAKPASPPAQPKPAAAPDSPADGKQGSLSTAPDVTRVAGVDPERPKLVDSGEIRPNGAVVSGASGKYIGKSTELAKAIFQLVKPGELAPKVYEVEDGFVVFRLLERKEPDLQAFEKEKDQLAAEYALEKSYRIVEEWSSQRCVEVKNAGAIRVNQDYVDYGDVDETTGKKRPTLYSPCASGALSALAP